MAEGDEGADEGGGHASAPRTARARARAEITAEILAAARRQLATDGAPALSLRAIARDLGMVSSAVYRYFASRDELLTRLIVDAYDALGEAVEEREARVERADLVGRLGAICTAVRAWALANPNEYALIYGSPVPGYVAPETTIGPASRVALLLVGVLLDVVDVGRPAGLTRERPLDAHALAAVQPVREFVGPGPSDELIVRGLLVWSSLFGTVSFELFGQLRNVVLEGPGDRDAFFDECVSTWARDLGAG